MNNDIQNSQESIPARNFPNHLQAMVITVVGILLTFLLGFFAIKIGIGKTEVFLIEFFTVVPAFIFVVQKKFSLVHVFRLRPVNLKIIFTAAVIGLALIIISDEFDRLTQLLFPMPEELLNAIKDYLIIRSRYDFFIIVISAVILAAICEELLFRGFLQTSMEHTFDITKAIMLTALFFAVVHVNPWWTIQLMLFAIFLGVLSWKSNSIIPSIIVHFLNNGVALIFTNVDESHFSWYLYKGHVTPYLLVIAGIVLIIGLKKFYTYCEEYHEQHTN